ncbi:Heat shock protein 16 [Termitomyces sp. T112]|nr:Heat shock protein 16 [Termitomyces sp. T112]
MSSLFYYEPFYHFEKLLDDAFSTRVADNDKQIQCCGQDAGVTGFLRPRMDLYENSESNMVTATLELPGLKKEDVSIDIHNSRLTISGESKLSTEHNERGYAIHERRFGRFSRTLQLPQGIEEEDIKAKLDDGVLSISFPKTSAEEAPKKITIS